MARQLIFYYREGCHLCDAMRKALHRFSSAHEPVDWTEIDIDADPELIKAYDVLVPVLTYNDVEICHYFFDEAALKAALAPIKPL